MSKETLKALRLFVPGVMMLVLSLPLFQRELDFSRLASTLKWLDGLLYVLICSVVGALYHVTGARDYFLRNSLRSIDDNIKDKLLSACASDAQVAQSADRIRQGRLLLNVFYFFVDNHETLKEKAKDVHFSGLMCSSTVE